MPEVNQYMFKHREVLELLIKKAGIHEGKWTLIMGFGFSGMNIGPSPEDPSPGAIVAVTNRGIQRATGPEAPPSLTLDAAEVNPPSST